MLEKFEYKNYIGSGFVYVGAASCDKKVATSIGNYLVKSGINVFFDMKGAKDADNAKVVAEAIDASSKAIFLISKSACASLEFRNAVNYALSIHKDILVIKLDDAGYTGGLEMQLANIPSIRFMTEENLVDELREREIITQDILGSGNEKKNVNLKKQITVIALAVVMIVGFIVGSTIIVKNRIAYYNSAEYILRDADGAEYINIAKYGSEGLEALAGKSVKELDLTDGNFDSLFGIESITAETVNITGLNNVDNLDYVFYLNGLKKIKLSQDMLDKFDSNMFEMYDYEIVLTR